jgi:hypothetical protein
MTHMDIIPRWTLIPIQRILILKLIMIGKPIIFRMW